MRRNLVVLIVCVGALAMSQRTNAEDKTIRVYVFTAKAPEGTFTPIDQKDREDSVKDLKRWGLNGGSPPTITVDRAAEADILVEVLGREREGDVTTKALRVRMTAGDFTTELVGRHGRAGEGAPLGKLAPDTGYWSDAAGDVARQIHDWLKANRELVLARRKPKK